MQYNSLADAIIAIGYRLYEVLSGIKFLVASLGGRGGRRLQSLPAPPPPFHHKIALLSTPVGTDSPSFSSYVFLEYYYIILLKNRTLRGLPFWALVFVWCNQMVNHRVRYQSPNMYPTSHSNHVYELSAVHGCHEVAKPHNWSIDSCHCKNKIVTLAFGYYSCMTVFTMQIWWMQCWKLKTHAVVTDTSLPQNVLQPPHCLNYHRKDSHAIANNLLKQQFCFYSGAEGWILIHIFINCQLSYKVHQHSCCQLQLQYKQKLRLNKSFTVIQVIATCPSDIFHIICTSWYNRKS